MKAGNQSPPMTPLATNAGNQTPPKSTDGRLSPPLRTDGKQTPPLSSVLTVAPSNLAKNEAPPMSSVMVATPQAQLDAAPSSDDSSDDGPPPTQSKQLLREAVVRTESKPNTRSHRKEYGQFCRECADPKKFPVQLLEQYQRDRMGLFASWIEMDKDFD